MKDRIIDVDRDDVSWVKAIAGSNGQMPPQFRQHPGSIWKETMILIVATLILWFSDLIDTRYGVSSRTQHPTTHHFNKQSECGCREKRGEPRQEGIPNQNIFSHWSGIPFVFHDIQGCDANTRESLLFKIRDGHFVIIQGLSYH